MGGQIPENNLPHVLVGKSWVEKQTQFGKVSNDGHIIESFKDEKQLVNKCHTTLLLIVKMRHSDYKWDDGSIYASIWAHHGI